MVFVVQKVRMREEVTRLRRFTYTAPPDYEDTDPQTG